jgi:hypothetical protein
MFSLFQISWMNNIVSFELISYSNMNDVRALVYVIKSNVKIHVHLFFNLNLVWNKIDNK